MCVLDGEGRTVFANRAAEELTGYESGALIGEMNHEMLHHSRDDGSPYALGECPPCSAFREGVACQTSEGIFWSQNGEMIPVEYTADPVVEDGKVTGAVVIFRDVSAGRRTGEDLEKRFKDLLGESVEGLVLTESGKVFGANKSFLEHFGYRYDEVVGMDAGDFVAPEDRASVESQVSASRMETYEARGLRKDGTSFLMQIQPRNFPYLGREVRITSVLDLTERREVERELRQQRDLYEGVLSAQRALGGGFVIVEGQRIVYANEGARDIGGYEFEEMAAMSSFMDFVAEEEKASLIERQRQRTESGEGESHYDTALRHKDGHRVEVEISFKELEAERGVRFLILVRDITVRKRAEAEARRQAELMDLSHDAIIVRDFDDIVVCWNRGASEMYGFAQEEAVGRVVHELLDTEFLSPKEAIDESLEKHGSWKGELLHVGRDGARLTVESRQTLAHEGGTTTVLEINRDITERKKNEEALRFFADSGEILGSSLDYRATLSSLARQAVPYLADWCAVDVVEDDGALERLAVTHKEPEKVELAHELERRYTTDPESPQGVPNVVRTGEPEVVPEIPASLLAEVAVDEQHLALLEQPDIRSYMILPLLARGRKLGALTLVASESGRRYGPEDVKVAEELARRAALAIDSAKLYEESQREIAVRKRVESELEARAEDLRRSNAELEQFAYVASHDLQEPLRMVSSYTQLLARRYKDQLDDDAGEFIGYAVDGAERMQRLINDLLVYSRVGTRGKEFTQIDCNEVFAAVRDNLRIVVEESGAELTSGELPTVMGDRSQLIRLLQNLTENALKFKSERPPEVSVRAESRGDEWVFSVRDNGIGLDPEYVDRIFVIFQRLHSRVQYPGTGIGLAVCKKIVERHGGRIWVESTVGERSIFRFTIPAQRRPE